MTVKRLAWLTDIHLNFLQPAQVTEFLARLRECPADAFLLSGDIAEGHNLLDYLQRLDDELDKPVYFVLGNHDFYRNSIAMVRGLTEEFCKESRLLTYLTRSAVIELTPTTGLVGHDGWADGRLGDFANSDVYLNDYLLIREIVGRDKQLLGPRLRQLGDEAAAHFRAVLPAALAKYQRLLVVTHVPPYREACWHEGRLSNDNWLPHFSCKAVGDVLREFMLANSGRQMTVLCGHTHGQGEAQILDNLKVLTGGAEYGQPAVQRVLEVE